MIRLYLCVTLLKGLAFGAKFDFADAFFFTLSVFFVNPFDFHDVNDVKCDAECATYGTDSEYEDGGHGYFLLVMRLMKIPKVMIDGTQMPVKMPSRLWPVNHR